MCKSSVYKTVCCALLICAFIVGSPIIALAETAAPTETPETTPVTTPASSPAPTITPLQDSAIIAESAILIDGLSGEVLYEKNPDARRYPASITKIMTALLAIENGNLTDIVTCGNEINQVESGSSSMYLKVDEELSLENILYGLMLKSGNDAANAIAVHIGGTIDGFVQMMNDKARELGMTESHFVTTNGLHDDNHYVTARDMATLTMYAMRNETFAKIVGTAKYSIPATNKTEERELINGNRLIHTSESESFRYEYAVGVKTGYTSLAGNTLVSAARKDGMLLIAVALKDSQEGKWTDCIKMFEHGFANYLSIDLMNELANRPLSVQLPNASQDDPLGGVLDLIPEPDSDESSYYVTIKYFEKDSLLTKISNAALTTEPNLSTLKAPIEDGTIVARFQYDVSGETILTGRLRAARTVEEKKSALGFGETSATNPEVSGLTPSKGGDFNSIINIVLIVLGIAIALVLIMIIIRTAVRNRRYSRRQLHLMGSRARPRSRSRSRSRSRRYYR